MSSLSKKKTDDESSVRPAPPAPTPAPPEPAPIDVVNKAIAEVQADPEFHMYSVEHLEVAAIRKLVDGGMDEQSARDGVQDRLYNSYNP